MKYVDEYRDPVMAEHLIEEIRRLAEEPISIMEICGGHTHAIFRAGIDQVLEPQIRFLHGPGCPVCVTPIEKIDRAIALARRPKTIIATYGDMLRVPGSESTLMKEKAKGAQVKMVYSSLDAVALAEKHPDFEVVFFAVGFETTIPANGFSILRARELGLRNYSVLCNHVLVPPVIRFLLEDPDVQIDAFIGPGHVGTVVGSEDYRFIAEEFGRPVVISGFEPNDILQSVYMILKQRQEGRRQVEIQYSRAVKPEGNVRARAVLNRIFEPVDQEWRGIGTIPRSGMAIREEFRDYDAEFKFQSALTLSPARESPACICGEITKGVKEPWQCESFGTACTPENPIGTCMVSSEGTCAAYYKYQFLKRAAGGMLG
ncbi:MAG TPA: hydrogenase formation protein HypD [Alicyclobacillus sp.]|nr:hydrogenase formation protein HypD [Alicyclobacillus sp.]